MSSPTAIERAIALMGSQQKLAEALKCNKTQVNHWKPTPKKDAPTPIPARHCIAIERLTGISCEELNPGIDWAIYRRAPIKRRPAKPNSGAPAVSVEAG